MNKMACFLVLGLFPALLRADEISHQVLFPQGDLAWSVTFQNDPAAAPPPGAPAAPRKFVRIDIVRQGDIRRDVAVLSDGGTDEMWWIETKPAWALVDHGGGVAVMSAVAFGDVRFDAPSFAWVGAKTYVGKKSFDGVTCQYYQEAEQDGRGTYTLRAWIDPATRLPVALDNGSSTVEFTFQKDAESPPLEMPEKFRQKYQAIQAFYTPPHKPGH